MYKTIIERHTRRLKQIKSEVQKWTGLSAEDVDALNESLKAMSTPTSLYGLNTLACAAGKLGITDKDKILEFVEDADRLHLAMP